MRPALSFVLALAVALGCRPQRPPEAGDVVPELKLEGVRFRVYREASLRASGNARAATFRRGTTEVAARELSAVLRGDRAPVAISAPEGGGVLDRRTFWASGGLTATRGDDTARTARAEYRPDGGSGRGLVVGDQPIQASGKGYRLEGHEFTYDPALGEIVVTHGARLESGPEARR